MVRRAIFVVFGLIVLVFVPVNNGSQAQEQFPPCPAGEGPNRIWAGNYPSQYLYQNERDWLCQIFGDCRAGEQASTGYGGKSCNGAHMDPHNNFRAMICRSGAVGPNGITPGNYNPVDLHQNNPSGQQWLWEIFRENVVGDDIVPQGWGGYGCPGDPEFKPPVNPPAPPPQSPGGSEGGAPGQSQPPQQSQNQVNAVTRDGLDIAGYCTRRQWTVELIGPFARDWKCRNTNGEYFDISMNALCNEQFGLPHFGLRDGYDPYSWYCASSPQSVADGPTSTVGSGGAGGSDGSEGGYSTDSPEGSGCNQSLPLKFTVGQRVETIDVNVNLRSGAGIYNVILDQLDNHIKMTIVRGPQCADGYRFWYVELDNGDEGWLADSGAGAYWLGSISSSASNGNSGGSSSGDCSRAPSSVFSVGDQAVIVNSPFSDPLNVRSSPSNSGSLVAELTDGTIITIIGGPVCENGYRRWQIRAGFQIEGWVRDGRDGQRWLEEVSDFGEENETSNQTGFDITDYDLGPGQTAATSASLRNEGCLSAYRTDVVWGEHDEEWHHFVEFRNVPYGRWKAYGPVFLSTKEWVSEPENGIIQAGFRWLSNWKFPLSLDWFWLCPE